MTDKHLDELLQRARERIEAQKPTTRFAGEFGLVFELSYVPYDEDQVHHIFYRFQQLMNAAFGCDTPLLGAWHSGKLCAAFAIPHDAMWEQGAAESYAIEAMTLACYPFMESDEIYLTENVCIHSCVCSEDANSWFANEARDAHMIIGEGSYVMSAGDFSKHSITRPIAC